MCEKVSYKDKYTALSSCKGIYLSKRVIHPPVRAYRCVECGMWHVTSSKRKLKEYSKRNTNLDPGLVPRSRTVLIIRNFSSQPLSSLYPVEHKPDYTSQLLSPV